MSVKILTDSTSYINEDICQQLDITKTSLYVTFESGSYKELEISNEEFYKKMDQEGVPLSSQPPLGEMLKTMISILEKGHDLLAVFLSSKMSGSFESALILKDALKEDFPNSKIEIIDSQSNSMQLGFAAIAGARLAQEGKSFQEVVNAVKENIVRSRFVFIPDKLDYLKKGGRIGGAGALLGNMLKLTPVLTVKDSETNVLRTVRTKSKAKKVLIDQLLEDHKKYGVQEIAIHHIDALEEAKQLLKDLKEEIDVHMHIANIGPVIGLHVGPGAIGLAYYTDKEIKDE